MYATAFCAVLLVQDPDLAAVQASQERRVATMARVAKAVCSVMAMDAPGGGSGVVIDPSGFVLTNYHVVGAPDGRGGENEKQSPIAAAPKPTQDELNAWRNAHPDQADADAKVASERWQQEWLAEHLPQGKQQWRHKKIGLPDGELYEAVVLGIDPGSDLAVLRLLPKKAGQTWPSCELGDSDQLLVGQTVFAMGNPFSLATDFTPTVTFGIVSGTHRYQAGEGNRMLVYPDCIQVDAPVNPGNSGGPLFSEIGEVIGINGRISIGDRGRVNVGVGFAIASNQIRNFLGDLLAGRHAEHGTLDLSSWSMAAKNEAVPRTGVFVQQLYRDSVAADAGMALGDELTRFDGQLIRSANQLATLIGVLPAGAWVTVGYRPQVAATGYGKEITANLKLNKLDTGSSVDAKADTDRLGSRVDRRIATDALSRRATSPMTTSGALLVLQMPDGTQWRAAKFASQLRIDWGGIGYVLGADGGAFQIENGKAAELTADAAAWLHREFACNPFLWTSGERAQRMSEALLVGGVHVIGRPAYRYALPGDGEMEFYLFEDGAPAGYRLRDPVRKKLVTRHFAAPVARVIVDGALEASWSVQSLTLGAEEVPGTFRRPL
ncbi:MAG: trypsin-like peptidase domain-containing protein [Planctomycetota bacterium]|nr:trypsin-like peptidase domain-containing protein [Planctomycetota bacterium]